MLIGKCALDADFRTQELVNIKRHMGFLSSTSDHKSCAAEDTQIFQPIRLVMPGALSTILASAELPASL